MKKRCICHITTVHMVTDTRILWRECASAAMKYHVVLIAPHDRQEQMAGVTIKPLRRYRRRPIRMTWGALRAFIAAWRTPADIYHFHDPELLPWMALLSILRRKPVIYDVHEHVERFFFSKEYLRPFAAHLAQRVYGCLERLSFSRFAAIVAACPPVEKELTAKYPANRTIITVNNFPRTDKWDAVKRQFNSDSRDIIYVGRVCKERTLHNLVHAMSFVDGRLHLVGDYEDESYRQILRQTPGWEKVIEHGYLDRERVRKLMADCQTGVNVLPPTQNNLQSYPNKLFEYMAAGLPIVASNFPLWRQLIADNDCGVMVDPLSPESIAAGITRIFDDPQSARRMSEKGRKLALETYNWSREEAKLLALYARLLGDTS
ncbi:MAG: glycosyltransferase family 4 protein [Candidatus Cloacimonetes bacterium]|nr:glycosyltransferase family 4 protein [Candidatus Cloacimonadota bacterium]